MIESDVQIWEEMFVLLFIFIFAFIGGVLKCYVCKVLYNKAIKINEILVSTLISVIIGYYAVIPMVKQYHIGTRGATGLLLMIGFAGFNVTEFTFNAFRELTSVNPKGVLIVIASILLRLIGIRIDIKELLNKKESKPYSDIHNNTYTTINNTYNNIPKYNKEDSKK